MNNLVLITSVINTPNKPLSYSKIRSIFTRNERFNDTKKTIKTIKDKIPNLKIMLVECSDLTIDELSYFNEQCDYILNLYEYKELHNNIFGLSKSLGEGTMTIKALEYIEENQLQFDNLFKISGRYWLSDIFDYNNFNNKLYVFKKIRNNIENIFTALYKIPFNKHIFLKKFLIENLNKMKQKIGFEILFGKLLKDIEFNNIFFVDTIGLNGRVTIDGSFYNG
jgi:hypothetical protein